MARASRPAGPTPVESLRHVEDSRTNIPTAEGSEAYFDAARAALPPTRYPRNAERDPQLVWRGKDTQDDELTVDAPPIYIQEKIDPRVLIENLRRSPADGPADATSVPELWSYDDFDGLDGLDAIDYYRHDARWTNRMILGDSLRVMGSLAERESLRGQVQMVYIDPPYGIKFDSNWQVRTSRRDVVDGKREDSAREAEQIKAFRDTWADGIHTYLSYLRDRLTVARELLTETGSIFVQIGDKNVHLMRSLLDEVFGAEHFVSQIAFQSSVGLGAKTLDGVVAYVLWYGRSPATKYRNLYRQTRPGEAGASRYRRVMLPDGTSRPVTAVELEDPSALPPGAHLFVDQGLTSRTASGTTSYPIEFGGKRYVPTAGGWRTSAAGMERVRHAHRLIPAGTTLRFVKYWDDFPAISLTNLWDDVSGGISSRLDPKIYVVQTPTSIIERCLLMSTDPGDLVLDPTCGSGTTAHVAEQWGRRWITIDTSRVAIALARQRLMGGRYPYYVLADSEEGRRLEGLPPAITGNDIHRGFVYERLRRVTLRSIANNPDLHAGMSRPEADAAIARHAESEPLYDRPKVDSRTVRVSGPFTVESLSPHRSLSFDEVAAEHEPRSERAATEDAGSPTFEQSILENLAKSGIQNGSRSGRFTFASLEPYAGRLVQAVGERRIEAGESAAEASADEATTRVAIAIGPQYGTVSAGFVKAALREARELDPAVDVLYVLGFAFDPNIEGERLLGRIRVEAVRMNVDLLMIDALKKTGAGNLFTVFGEPDIEVRTRPDGRLEVELRGVDVFNPNTGEVRSSAPTQIALWMIDTRYDEESFFVRHAYFTGDNDPYLSLKAALKADVDPEAWEALHRTSSLPFDRPETGRIAVKVINDYGDEVMKVFPV
ncbi:MAG TPA: site-specific DNA-methyltransferase [Gryllotalpicola sp.]